MKMMEENRDEWNIASYVYVNFVPKQKQNVITV
jgi:hypothetical protein